MRTFSGRLWLVKDRYSEIDAELLIDLDQERIRITSDAIVIGDWSFDELDVTRDEKEIHLTVEGEELVMVSGDIWFAPALEQVFAALNRGRHSAGSIPPARASGDLNTDENTDAVRSVERRRRRGAHRRRGSFKFKW